MEIIGIIIVAILVNNVVFSQFLGICPFMGVSKKLDTAIGMSAAVTFVLTLATLVSFLIQKSILEPFGLEYLQTITFILVIASLVQMVEIIIKKIWQSQNFFFRTIIFRHFYISYFIILYIKINFF